MEQMRCNGCGAGMPASTQCVATSCKHLYCTGCAQKILENDDACPICHQELSKSNIKLVNILQTSSASELALCGQSPQMIMQTALTGISFYVEQQSLMAQYTEKIKDNKFNKMQEQCKAKLEALHNGYQQAKRKYQEAVQQRNALDQDNQELQQKYQQKSSQARKLHDMLKVAQQEIEELRRRVGAAGGPVVAGRLGGSGSNRGGQPSPFGQGAAHLVTTVHQHKSIIELSPTPGTGFLTGQSSATVGPQHRLGSSGAFGNMFGGSSPGLQAIVPTTQRRPGTAGGNMFNAAGGRTAGGIAGGSGGLAGSGGIGGNSHRIPRGGLAGLGSPGQGMLSM